MITRRTMGAGFAAGLCATALPGIALGSYADEQEGFRLYHELVEWRDTCPPHRIGPMPTGWTEWAERNPSLMGNVKGAYWGKVRAERELVGQAEKALQAEAIAVNRLFATSTPRWSRWHESWAARRTVVRHIVEEHQPSWLALPTCLALDDGRLAWFYRRGCEFGGRFTVPYLCDESDLVARIRTHRPGDYADPNGCGVPGYVPGYWGRY